MLKDRRNGIIILKDVYFNGKTTQKSRGEKIIIEVTLLVVIIISREEKDMTGGSCHGKAELLAVIYVLTLRVFTWCLLDNYPLNYAYILYILLSV